MTRYKGTADPPGQKHSGGFLSPQYYHVVHVAALSHPLVIIALFALGGRTQGNLAPSRSIAFPQLTVQFSSAEQGGIPFLSSTFLLLFVFHINNRGERCQMMGAIIEERAILRRLDNSNLPTGSAVALNCWPSFQYA